VILSGTAQMEMHALHVEEKKKSYEKLRRS